MRKLAILGLVIVFFMVPYTYTDNPVVRNNATISGLQTEEHFVRSLSVTESDTTVTKQYPRRVSRVRPNGVLTTRSVWDRLATCESTGRWHLNSGNGFYGGIQFDLASWHAAGGTGYPHQATRAEQIKRGKIWKAKYGWKPWPACARKLGLYRKGRFK